ncbi:hypothetical protein, partial [Nocardia sp. NPDC004722]
AASTPGSRLPGQLALGGLGVAAGLLLGMVAVWIRGRTDPVLRTTAHASTTGVPVLGTVSPVTAPSEREFLGYRGLRAHLEQLTPAPAVWVIASAAGEADVSTVVGNLSRTIERHGGQPLILTADSTDPIRARESIEPARTGHTHVLVAAPPVTKSVAASVYGEFGDGVILLVALGATRRRELREAVAQLRSAAIRVPGIVVATTHRGGKDVETQSN